MASVKGYCDSHGGLCRDGDDTLACFVCRTFQAPTHPNALRQRLCLPCINRYCGNEWRVYVRFAVLGGPFDGMPVVIEKWLDSPTHFEPVLTWESMVVGGTDVGLVNPDCVPLCVLPLGMAPLMPFRSHRYELQLQPSGAPILTPEGLPIYRHVEITKAPQGGTRARQKQSTRH